MALVSTQTASPLRRDLSEPESRDAGEQLATLEWVDWFNNRRLYAALDYVPPAEYEASWYTAPLPAGAGTQG